MKRVAVPLLLLLCGCAALPAAAQLLVPDAGFVQIGAASNRTRSAAAGLAADWPWRRDTALGAVSGYSEVLAGVWSARRSDAGTASGLIGQVGVTPVLRLGASAPTGWFVEAGIGANLLLPKYRSGDKRFSTAFQFGDHVGLGWRFDGWEAALRYEHFSNASVSKPNPGDELVQLRCAFRF